MGGGGSSESVSHRAAFLETNDPSLRDHGTVDDLVRMRHDQSEFVSTRVAETRVRKRSGLSGRQTLPCRYHPGIVDSRVWFDT